MARSTVTPPKAFRITALAGVVGLLALGSFSDFIPAPFMSGRSWIAPMWLLGAAMTAIVAEPDFRTRMQGMGGEAASGALATPEGEVATARAAKRLGWV